MKISNIFKAIAYSMVFSSIFFINTSLSAKEELKLFNREKPEEKYIYASFHSSVNQDLSAGQSVLFEVEDFNEGHGIKRVNDNTEFKIKESGNYIINFGIKNNASNAISGLNLILTRKDNETIIAQLLVQTTSSIILHLKEDDKIKIVAQTALGLRALPTVTNFSTTDTAFITFVQLDQ